MIPPAYRLTHPIVFLPPGSSAPPRQNSSGPQRRIDQPPPPSSAPPGPPRGRTPPSMLSGGGGGGAYPPRPASGSMMSSSPDWPSGGQSRLRQASSSSKGDSPEKRPAAKVSRLSSWRPDLHPPIGCYNSQLCICVFVCSGPVSMRTGPDRRLAAQHELRPVLWRGRR